MKPGSKIVVLCSRLDLPGGIERAVVQTANLWQRRGHCVTLVVLDESPGCFYELHPNVNRVHEKLDFGIGNGGHTAGRKWRLVNHLICLRRLLCLHRPELIIGTEYVFTIAAFLVREKKTMRVFAWEHHHFRHLRRSRFWQTLHRWIYPKLDGVVCLNPREAELFSSHGSRTFVIPNFVEQQKRQLLPDRVLLTVGWLSYTKGVDLIPAVAKKIFARYPHWRWHIVGSGEGEAALRTAILEQGLSQNVFIFRPVSASIEALYAGAALCVMTSRMECFPMVLLEAMAQAIPCIAFDCPTGPAFIIQNNVDGKLVANGNVDVMAEAINELIANGEKRLAFGAAAYENIGRFSEEKIYRLWTEL